MHPERQSMRTSIPRDRQSWSLFPRENRDVWNLFGVATLMIFLAPMFRSGWMEASMVFHVPYGIAPILSLFSLGAGALLSLVPLGFFLVWSWPRFERRGLPWRSFLLLGLLLAYLPIQAIFQPNFYGENGLKYVQAIDAAQPAIWMIRHLDKPTLLLLTVWAVCRGRSMAPKAQVAFHWILFLCLIWALCLLIDVSFGKSFHPQSDDNKPQGMGLCFGCRARL